ncbi:cadherin-like beta sandwich domain-containing protein [Paenibacillus chondroitinus]|uniref:Cadherin-like beta sandwich domain-containing protein n=1 Tax=Paenibacillus chondroitinus TaxID=59842 RepID=A0ABU6D4A8_9BACL|nr:MULTISPECIES: cadherin-like beta sandwich domain-containing protein [Paenibacillus]MCY9660916.1 cadherin-like beta sandwich domain-containing protein [Paenibacillus anseongense]MEB4792286.1 cadherin-like beta sandwich domain-containing protein [Paenibacillus chondroitinus]
MLKNLQRAGIMLICFLLVFGTMLGQKTMAATQQPGDQHSVIPNEPITGAAYGNGVYVAVGYYGKILKSTDGFDWQIAADRSRLDVTYTSVAFGGNQFVAVGDQGTVMTSPDGTVWTQRDSTISSRIDRVAYVQNLINKFFAVTTGGKVITSSDGKTWSSMTIGTSNNLTSIAVSDTTIVIGDSGGYVHTSTDGSTWTKHTKLSGSFFINSVLSLNNRFYANDALGSSYTSLDGITWSGPFRAAGNTSSQIFGGLYDTVNFKYYLFGYDGTSYGGIFTSTNGTTFQQQPKGSTMTAQNAFYAKGVFMQLGNDGIVVSTDGVNWQYPYGGSFGNVIYDGSRYVAVGRNGNDGFIKGSVDGINWSKVNLNLVPAMTSIIYFNGKYVAVGNWGTVATSSDGTTWTVNPTAISDYKLTSVAYGNGVLIAVDEIGTIYKSTNNGVTWLPPVREDTDNYNALQFVSYTSGKFYAVGDYDTYLESTDSGDSWHVVASTAVPSAAFFNINMMQQADIPVTLTNTLKSITVSNRGTTLNLGTDFTVSGSVVTLKKEFLSQLAEGWQTFTFHSSNGASQTFAIKVTNTSAALGQAATVKLSKDGIATWNPVAGAAGYEVQLYRNDSVWGSAVLTSAGTLSADFLSAMRSAGPGKYTFKVKAKGNMVNYKDGQQSAASNIVEIYKAPTEDAAAIKAGTAQNVNFSIKVNNAVNGALVTAQVAGANVLDTVINVTADASGKATLPIDITKLAEGSNDIVIAFTVGTDNFSEELTVTLTKDTIAPLVPTEDGTADKAGTTQNTNFNIVVNAETDAKVTAQVGAANVLQTGTDVKAANGKATLLIDLAKLAENANQIAVVVTDAAGNASGTLTVPVTKDTIAPNKPLEDGSADKANTTQNTNFDIIVTAENGAKVTAKVGGTNVLQSGLEVTAATNKAVLPIDVAKLAEGPNSVTIEAKDAVGNTSTALTITVNKDTSPPNVPTEDGTANKAGTTQNANFNIIVNAETGSAVTAKVGGANVLQSGISVTAVGGKATLPIDFTKLAEGSNVIEVVATDAIGNASNALTVAVAIDTTAPSTPTEDGTAQKAGTTQNANFSIIVNAESGAAVTAKVGGTSVLQSSVTAANGKATLPIDLSLLTEGVNSIDIVATDGMGNASGTLTVPVTKDITPPAAPVEDGSANKDNTTQNANFDIIVTAENGTTVTAKVGSTNVLLSGSEVTAANNKADLPIDVTKLAEGPNSITIEAKDAVGNPSVTLTITVNKDTKSPDDPAEDGTANKAGTTQNANFNIIVNAETGSTVTAKVGATNVLQSGTSVTAVGGKATLPIDFTKLPEGPNVIKVIATDATGNASNALSVEVTIDTTPPTDPTEDGTAPKAGTTQNANFSIIVNAESGAAVTAKVGGTSVLESGTSVTAVSGKATLPINLSLLMEGLNNIEIVVTDGMGAASGTLTVPVTKDTSPPAVPVEDGSADKNNTAQTDNFNIIVDTEAGANVTAMVGNNNVLQAGTTVTAVGGKAILPIDLSKLAMGDNEIKIVATDAIGNSSTALTVKVTRELSSNADLSALGVSRGSLNEIFAAGTTNYTLSVANNVETMTVTPTTADAGASVTVKGQTVQSGHASADIALNVGVNHIEIVVTAVNHTTKTYTIDVTRISNNALLADLSVDQGTLTPDFSNSQLHYQVEVPNTVSGLNMFLVKAEPSETITVTGATYSTVTGDVYTYSASNLNVGSNTISIVVTAQDGTTNNTYSLTVERAPILSENADLSSLKLSNGALTPAFAAGQTSYTSNVANAVSSLSVTGTLADSHSTMTVNGIPALSGQISGNMNLIVGANLVTVIVTAQNGTQKIYTVTVNRAAQEITDEHENEHDDAGNPGSVNSDPNSVTGTNGQLTLQVGQSGVVSLGDSITISIPAGAIMKELKLSIERLVNTQNLIKDKEILVSPIFEILKNFTENFSKPVTLSFAFNPSAVQKDQRPSVYYYDEVQKQWVEVAGGIVNGDRITVAVNHFTKYAVFAVGPTEPTKGPSGNPAFRDIAGHWAEVSIQNAVNGGIVSGYPDSTFKPDSTVTRAEFAVMLMNALKLQGEGAQLTFTDNAKIGAWAQQAIGKAVKAGIIHGYEDGSFRPDAPITRAEMAVIIANAMGASTTAGAATGFSDDETIPAWAKGSVAFVKQAGIVQGRDNNTFAPQANATRAESVVVLLKALEKKNK